MKRITVLGGIEMNSSEASLKKEAEYLDSVALKEKTERLSEAYWIYI